MQQLLNAHGPDQLASGLHILLALTLMALAPAILVLTTGFTRILIVLAFARQALGTPNIPPNIVLIPLAGFLTLISMGPMADQVYNNALQPAMEGKLTPIQAYEAAAAPLRAFMQKNTRQKDLALLLQASRLPRPANLEQVPDRILIPAFVLSELKAAFTMGFALFLAFLAVDLVVAGILMALGMFMVPPMSISLPIKLLLFVLVDGWSLIAQSLLGSFVT